MKNPNSPTKKIRARDLDLHPVAHRDLVPAKVDKFVREMDLDSIGVFHAVEYLINGTPGPWQVDGHHRKAALIKKGLGHLYIETKIHKEVKDDARACELFLRLNDRTIIHAYDRYLNELVARYPVALGIEKITEENGLHVAKNSSEGGINCIDTLKTIYTWDDGVSLSSGLGTCVDAWGTGASVLERVVVKGVCLVFKKHNGTIDKDIMIKKLSKTTPARLVGIAKTRADGRKAISKCVANVVIESYNKSRKKRLDLIS